MSGRTQDKHYPTVTHVLDQFFSNGRFSHFRDNDLLQILRLFIALLFQ